MNRITVLGLSVALGGVIALAAFGQSHSQESPQPGWHKLKDPDGHIAFVTTVIFADGVRCVFVSRAGQVRPSCVWAQAGRL